MTKIKQSKICGRDVKKNLAYRTPNMTVNKTDKRKRFSSNN